jgi:hypothetical protein
MLVLAIFKKPQSLPGVAQSGPQKGSIILDAPHNSWRNVLPYQRLKTFFLAFSVL